MRKTRSDKGVPQTHGFVVTHKKIYKIYFSMRSRCEKGTDPAYHRYGARGITVCKEWSTPEPFCRWAIENGYSPSLTLERKDNSKGYSPDNCIWATRTAQARNRRSNHMITIGGQTRPAAEWIEIYKILPRRAYSRINRGWTGERIFTTPPRRTSQCHTSL